MAIYHIESQGNGDVFVLRYREGSIVTLNLAQLRTTYGGTIAQLETKVNDLLQSWKLDKAERLAIHIYSFTTRPKFKVGRFYEANLKDGLLRTDWWVE